MLESVDGLQVALRNPRRRAVSLSATGGVGREAIQSLGIIDTHRRGHFDEIARAT